MVTEPNESNNKPSSLKNNPMATSQPLIVVILHANPEVTL